MNADYLAKMIFHHWNETEGVEIPQTLLEDAATMLREQQRTIDGDKRLIGLLYQKIAQQQSEIAELKNARDHWCLQYKDVFNKLEASEK